MTAMFDEDGNLVQLLGNQNARVESKQPAGETVLTGTRADLRFALAPKKDTADEVESQLHLVMADGQAVAESKPTRRP